MTDHKSTGTCPYCSAPIKADAKFCSKCGNRLSKVPVTSQQAEQVVSAAPLQSVSATTDVSAAPVPSPVAKPALLPTSGATQGSNFAAPIAPSAASVPTAPLLPSTPDETASVESAPSRGLAASVAGALQALAGFVRDLWPGGGGGPASETQRASTTPGNYGDQLKPVSGKASDIGNVRQVNEDSLIALEFVKVQESRGVPLGFYVVADGMGGHRAGEIASRTVNKIVTERVLNAEVIPGLAFATRKLDETPASVLTAAIKEANRVLYDVAQKQGSDMGTTLTAALIIGDTATIANVGDSRTYLWRGGTLRQVTEDHSLVASLVKANMLRPEEVRSHPQRNQVFRSLGTKPQVEPDIFTETLQRGDRLVLCSDGLWEMVPDPEIGRIVGRARSPQEACRALIQKAKDAGGDDNITVIVVMME